MHRLDGPAIEHADGSKWWFNGQLHRTDGPAIEYANGTKCWCINDQLHRTDGPAIEFASGTKKWYFKGKQISKKKFHSKNFQVKIVMES